MPCSPARLAANRANALRSTGPKTEEGKAASRANALTHGLAARVVRTAEEDAAVAEAGPPGAWLEGEIVVLTRRIDHARAVEDRERERAALRAGSSWDDDRKAEAERIGAGMARNPGRAVTRLRGTVEGCLWLLERWDGLLRAAGQGGGWDEAQHALADDLRGIPVSLRPARVDAADQAALAAKMADGLRQRRDAIAPADAFDRESARLGLTDSASPELRRAIRYEADLHRRLRWCQARLRDQAAATTPPAAKPAPAPARAPRPSQPGPDLDLDRFGEEDDFADLDARFGGPLPPIPAFVRDALAVSIFPARSNR